ncbi:hypothetical protein DFH28DRAFT_963248, partial [Melampsora americana]
FFCKIVLLSCITFASNNLSIPTKIQALNSYRYLFCTVGYTWTSFPNMHLLTKLSHTYIAISFMFTCSVALPLFGSADDLIKAGNLGKQADEGASGASVLQQGRGVSRSSPISSTMRESDIYRPNPSDLTSGLNLKSGLSQYPPARTLLRTQRVRTPLEDTVTTGDQNVNTKFGLIQDHQARPITTSDPSIDSSVSRGSIESGDQNPVGSSPQTKGLDKGKSPISPIQVINNGQAPTPRLQALDKGKAPMSPLQAIDEGKAPIFQATKKKLFGFLGFRKGKALTEAERNQQLSIVMEAQKRWKLLRALDLNSEHYPNLARELQDIPNFRAIQEALYNADKVGLPVESYKAAQAADPAFQTLHKIAQAAQRGGPAITQEAQDASRALITFLTESVTPAISRLEEWASRRGTFTDVPNSLRRLIQDPNYPEWMKLQASSVNRSGSPGDTGMVLGNPQRVTLAGSDEGQAPILNLADQYRADQAA